MFKYFIILKDHGVSEYFEVLVTTGTREMCKIFTLNHTQHQHLFYHSYVILILSLISLHACICFQTRMWTDLCDIANSYTKLLRVCLKMSKSYYRTELQNLREDKKIRAKGNTHSLITNGLFQVSFFFLLFLHFSIIVTY